MLLLLKKKKEKKRGLLLQESFENKNIFLKFAIVKLLVNNNLYFCINFSCI